MKIQLIHGQFSSDDATDLVTKMIQTKIKFHESRITNQCSEEDIKMRESKIKHLQKDLIEARKIILANKSINIEAEMVLN